MQDPVLELDVTSVDLTFPFYMVWLFTVQPYTDQLPQDERNITIHRERLRLWMNLCECINVLVFMI